MTGAPAATGSAGVAAALRSVLRLGQGEDGGPVPGSQRKGRTDLRRAVRASAADNKAASPAATIRSRKLGGL